MTNVRHLNLFRDSFSTLVGKDVAERIGKDTRMLVSACTKVLTDAVSRAIVFRTTNVLLTHK